jgi:hypothetical protein
MIFQIESLFNMKNKLNNITYIRNYQKHQTNYKTLI